MQGVLESTDREVKVIRLDRSGARQNLTRIDPESVRDLWADPLVRYSNLMDGIFHAGSVVCEGEGDCMFYAAVLDSVLGGTRHHDLHFTSVGGKARLGKALGKLRPFGVRTAVVCDLDVLNNATVTRELAEAAGMGWSAIAADYKVVSSDAKNRWDQLKTSGVAGIHQADASAAATRLLGTLRSNGVFVVPVGELERWVPSLPTQEWVQGALAGGHHENPSHNLRAFVRELAAYFALESQEHLPADRN